MGVGRNTVGRRTLKISPNDPELMGAVKTFGMQDSEIIDLVNPYFNGSMNDLVIIQ